MGAERALSRVWLQSQSCKGLRLRAGGRARRAAAVQSFGEAPSPHKRNHIRIPPPQSRPACAEGLARLLALRRCGWARQADDLGLWPSAGELLALDRKFGGALAPAHVPAHVFAQTPHCCPHLCLPLCLRARPCTGAHVPACLLLQPCAGAPVLAPARSASHRLLCPPPDQAS